MNAYALTNPDHPESTLWRCGVCKDILFDEPTATRCCNRKCEKCGVTRIENYESYCDPCRAKQRAEGEAEAYAEAEKLTDWDGPVWTDRSPRNEGYFRDVDAMAEWFGEQGEDGPKIPPYVWACTFEPFVKVSLARILDNIRDDAHDDFDSDDLNGVKELGEAIDAFNEGNKGFVTYRIGKQAILIHQALPGDHNQ